MSYSSNESDLELLTRREVEVIELVADGLSNQEIADTLVITLNTVKAHLKHIFTKFDTNKRIQAVARAREYGFLDPEDKSTTQTVQTMHNLPRSLIPLIGRDRELSDLAAYLAGDSHRLITIHGPGGIGKTHLAIEAAWQHTSDFQDGVFLVSLEPLDSSLFLLSAIGEALGFQFANQGDCKEQLLTHLSDKQMLLVMDGFEHLLDNTALIGDLLAAAPELKVIVTSRERLNIHGETLYSLKGYLIRRKGNRLIHPNQMQSRYSAIASNACCPDFDRMPRIKHRSQKFAGRLKDCRWVFCSLHRGLTRFQFRIF